MKRRGMGAVLPGMLLAAMSVATAATAQTGTVERPFVAGGQIRMDLSAADYTIAPGRDDRILVRWETRSADDASRVKVDIQRRGSEATITTHGPHNNLRMVVEIPARTDLHVDLSAGDLKIQGIEGSKDVGSWAGDISIDLVRANDYASVDAAVKAGDLTARPFKVSKGGLFRSFSWNGPGHYTLRVRLTAGDLTLYEGQAASAARPPEPPAPPRVAIERADYSDRRATHGSVAIARRAGR